MRVRLRLRETGGNERRRRTQLHFLLEICRYLTFDVLTQPGAAGSVRIRAGDALTPHVARGHRAARATAGTPQCKPTGRTCDARGRPAHHACGTCRCLGWAPAGSCSVAKMDQGREGEGTEEDELRCEGNAAKVCLPPPVPRRCGTGGLGVAGGSAQTIVLERVGARIPTPTSISTSSHPRPHTHTHTHPPRLHAHVHTYTHTSTPTSIPPSHPHV